MKDRRIREHKGNDKMRTLCGTILAAAVACGAKVESLVIRDSTQVNRTDRPMTFLRNEGEVKCLDVERIRFVALPGANIPGYTPRAANP